jgi:tape measure domain-containing protein
LGRSGAAGFSAGFKDLGRSVSSAWSGFTTSARAAVSGFASAVVTATSAAASAFDNLRTRVAKSAKSISSQVGMMAYQLQYAGLVASVAFTAPVTALGVFAAAIGVKFAAQIEDATVALRALLPAGYDVAALVKRLQDMAVKSPVFDSASLLVFTQKMVAAGVEIGKTERFLRAFGNIATTAGVPMDAMSRALEAFSQMAGKGVVNMEELRQQLGDALPGAMNIAAQGLGVTQQKLFEMVSAGQVTADTLMSAFIKMGESGVYLEGASTAVDTLRSRWNALVERVQMRLGEIVLSHADKIKAAMDKATPLIERMLKMFEKYLPGAIGLLDRFVTKLKDLGEWYDSLSGKSQGIVKVVAAIAIAAGPVLVLFGGLATVFAAAAAGVAFLASTAGLVIIAILAVIVLAVIFRDKIKEVWDSTAGFRQAIGDVVGKVKDELMPTLKDTWEKLKESFSELKNEFMSVWNDLKANSDGVVHIAQIVGAVIGTIVAVVIGLLNGIIRAVGPLLLAIVSFISGVVMVVTGIIQAVFAIVTGDWGGFCDALGLIWDGLWKAIVSTLYHIGDAIYSFVAGFVGVVVGWFKMLYDKLVGHSVIPDMVNGIIDWFGKLPGRVVAKLASLVSAAIDKFSSMRYSVLNHVTSMISSVVSFVAGLPGKVSSAIGNLSGTLSSAGRALISGLISGMSSMLSGLRAKAAEAARLAASVVKSALGIKSPSKVFAKIGRQAIAGMIVGIAAMTGSLSAAAATAADAVTAPVVMAASPPAAPGDGAGAMVAAGATALVIEHYHAAESSDPAAEAERLAWLRHTRGW